MTIVTDDVMIILWC